MTRKLVDRRDVPRPCTLAITGIEPEVEAQASHVLSTHHAGDGPKLGERVRAALNDHNRERAAG